MESATNTWHINPSDLLKPNNGDDMYGVNGLVGINFNENNDLGLPSQGMDLFSANYDDVDNILTQELKDLDIPLIPQAADMNNYSSGKNIINQMAIDEPYEIPKFPSMSGHKRGPSGTAIFGFSNHTKTLSITNFNRQNYETSENAEFPIDFNRWEKDSKASNTSIATDNALGHVLMKQQEELRIALERQQEVNRKLEQQLQENKIQQERLQRVLNEQEAVAHQLVSDSVSPQPNTTPIPKSSSKPNRNELIITSNCNNGSYQFPPPSMISPPISNTSINGSPSRRSHRGRPKVAADLDMQFPRYEIPSSSSVNEDSRTADACNMKNEYANPFCVGKHHKSPLHKKKESTVSTVSTIVHEENESSDNEGLIGLGIHSMSRRASKDADNYSLRAPPVDILPAIPGSTNNTPAKNSLLPQKHTFQHTPVKTQHNHHQEYSTHDKLFKDNIETPQLKPPPITIVSNRKSSCIDFEENDEMHLDDDEDHHNHAVGEEPESRFIIAKTPSPVLKSQGKFEGESPHFDVNGNTNGSPVKITRKPTTLPRGSIDKYVKELPNKLFECMYPGCHKIFKRRYNIRSHIQTHLEDRPYVCDFEGCNKAFVRNHDLVRHKKSHAEKTYACPCGKKFNREDALIVHRSRMICPGGKKYENIVIKKSPRRRGRPKKDEYGSESSSPVKDSFARDNDGYLMYKMEEQLRNEMEKYGLLRPQNGEISKHSHEHSDTDSSLPPHNECLKHDICR